MVRTCPVSNGVWSNQACAEYVTNAVTEDGGNVSAVTTPFDPGLVSSAFPCWQGRLEAYAGAVTAVSTTGAVHASPLVTVRRVTPSVPSARSTTLRVKCGLFTEVPLSPDAGGRSVEMVVSRSRRG